MTAYQVKIRNAVYSAIDLAKGTLPITDFTTERTYYPTSRLEEMGSTVEVKVTAMGIGNTQERILRNAGVKQLELAVLVHVQKRVEPTALSTIDALVELVEAIMQLCEDDDLIAGEDFQWLRTEPLRDENDAVYSYESLTVNGVFQAVFTLYYTYILQGA